MAYRVAAAAVLVLTSHIAAAQQPIPLLPSSPAAPSIEASPLGAPPDAPAMGAPAPGVPFGAPPAAPQDAPASGAIAPGAGPPMAQAPSASRVFCNQSVSYHLADAAPERYRQYLGIFSDAAWTPALCAALIVESVQSDGTATITYVFGPMSAGGKVSGSVLHGTGIVKDDALLFQNSDGSQFQFRPYYTDLAGHWTAPAGQTYDSIFKKTY